MSKVFPYSSLNEYLDSIFRGVDPTDAEIIHAKREYWKMYNTDLKRRRRKKVHEFLVGFSIEETQKLRSILIGEKGIAPLIRTIVLGFLDQTPPTPTTSLITHKIEQSLALIISYLEELCEDPNQSKGIQELINRISNLENLFNDY